MNQCVIEGNTIIGDLGGVSIEFSSRVTPSDHVAWCTAGWATWKHIREAVMVIRAQGGNITMEEGRGFLSRTFVFRGDLSPIQELHDYLAKRFKEKP